MEKFYTDTPNAEIIDELINVGYSLDEADPAFGITYPTYADVLDWFLNQDVEINIFREYDKKWTITSECNGQFDVHADDIREETFNEALDKAILLAIEFLKNDNL